MDKLSHGRAEIQMDNTDFDHDCVEQSWNENSPDDLKREFGLYYELL